jgi:enoyl-CoA hydratase
MWEAIPGILDQFEADEAIRVIVLKGAGERAFVAGADISEFEQRLDSAQAAQRYGAVANEAHRRLIESPKPTIAMIRGHCIGGGVTLALDCDLHIAESALFGVPAARLGLGYGAKSVKRLLDLVGPGYAKEIFYTARRYPAADALRMGLLNRVVADAALEQGVREEAAVIAESTPLTIGSIKHIVAELTGPDGRADLERCERLERQCFDSEDYA